MANCASQYKKGALLWCTMNLLRTLFFVPKYKFHRFSLYNHKNVLTFFVFSDLFFVSNRPFFRIKSLIIVPGLGDVEFRTACGLINNVVVVWGEKC